MKLKSSLRGYSLTELMIMTTLFGLLAMITPPAFQRINARSQGSMFMNDMRVFGEAFGRHAQERGSFPADQTNPHQVPAGMDAYFRQDSWLRTSPLGGTYEWDNKDAVNNLGVTLNAAIKVQGCTWTLAQLQELDRRFDDGDLTTGNLVVTDAGTTVVYVIERTAS